MYFLFWCSFYSKDSSTSWAQNLYVDVVGRSSDIIAHGLGLMVLHLPVGTPLVLRLFPCGCGIEFGPIVPRFEIIFYLSGLTLIPLVVILKLVLLFPSPYDSPPSRGSSRSSPFLWYCS